jgi:organic hydroperoxide reductase OsmC/OhrA
MKPRIKYRAFWYESEVRWESNHRGKICSTGKPEVKISSSPVFKGEAGIWTPEDLFVASVNACTMTTFLTYARHKNLPLVLYDSDAEGLMERVDGKFQFTKIVLNPHIEVKSEAAIPQAREILEDAHKDCFLTNSTTAEVEMFPRIRVSASRQAERAAA